VAWLSLITQPRTRQGRRGAGVHQARTDSSSQLCQNTKWPHSVIFKATCYCSRSCAISPRHAALGPAVDVTAYSRPARTPSPRNRERLFLGGHQRPGSASKRKTSKET
jgi:hypothetical protein